MSTTKHYSRIIVLLLAFTMIFGTLASAFSTEAYAEARYFGFRIGSETVHMLPGRYDVVKDPASKRVVARWALDDAGYFVISIEKPGDYKFQFLDLNEWSQDCTFGVTVIGGGGGGGGASIDKDENDKASETRMKKHDSVGTGGSGGQIVRQQWSSRGSGLRISDYLNVTEVKVGKGGDGGRGFYYCKCGGSACPIGHRKDCPWAYEGNVGKDGEDSAFGVFTAAGGKGGKIGTCEYGRYSGASAEYGEYGDGAGEYVFWGVTYRCGYPGMGGSFGINNGSAGDPMFFHFGYNSFGHSGITTGGKGNGGGGGGMSYTYGHPMITGTGTGTGGGSYSPTVEGHDAGGGDSDAVNGYVYIEGKINLSGERQTFNRYQLNAHILPEGTVNPIPKLTWASTNAGVAKVSQFGSAIMNAEGTAIVTATAPNNVQGQYFIDNILSSTYIRTSAVNIVADGEIKKVGDSVQLHANVVPNSNMPVSWSSTNPAVVDVDQTGKVTAKGRGTALVIATTTDGSQGYWGVVVGNGGAAGYSIITLMNLTAPKTEVSVGESVEMDLSTYPDSQFKGYWYNSSPGIADLDEDSQTVTFKKEGLVTITVKSIYGTAAAWTFYVKGSSQPANELTKEQEEAIDLLSQIPSMVTDVQTPQPPREGKMYTVQGSETLESLIVDVYGHPDYTEAMIALNNSKADSSNSGIDDINENDREIMPGQNIYFPPIEELEAWMRSRNMADNVSESEAVSIAGSVEGSGMGTTSTENKPEGIPIYGINAGRELFASVESEDAAKEIAGLYGIQLVSFEDGVAVYHTSSDPESVVANGTENNWPPVEINYVVTGIEQVDEHEQQGYNPPENPNSTSNGTAGN